MEQPAVVMDVPRLPWAQLTLELLTAAILGLLVAVNFAENVIRVQSQLNSDGIMYVRRAKYLLEGDWWNSISGYWSAGPIWCTAAVAWVTGLRSDTELLLAARYMLGGWAVLFTFASYAFLWRLGLPWLLRTTMTAIAGALAVTWGLGQIVPELLLATCLLVFWTIALSPRLFISRWVPVWLGVAGGVAYIAKTFALPYTLALLPGWLLVRWWFERDVAGVSDSLTLTPHRPTLVDVLRTWALATLGVILIAAPWVGALSVRYGELTLATNGSVNHLLMAPPDIARKHLQAKAFSTVPAPFHHPFEVVDWLPRTEWGPSSDKFFQHTFAVAGNHALQTLSVLQEMDRSDFGLIALCLAAVLGVTVAVVSPARVSPVTRRLGRDACLMVLMFLVYATPFLLVFFNRRFFLLPMAVPLMGVAGIMLSPLLSLPGWRRTAGRFAYVLLTFAVVASFWSVIGTTWNLKINDNRPDDDQQVAAAIKSLGLPGPMTMADVVSNKQIYLAHLADRQSFGFPMHTEDVDQIQGELDAAGVKLAVMWKNDRPDRGLEEGQALLLEVLTRPEWEKVFTEWTGPPNRSRSADIYKRTDVPARPDGELPPIYRIEPWKK